VKGVLFIGGKHPQQALSRKLAEDADLIVAADSGFDITWNQGIGCNYVVGDMDSTRFLKVIDKLPGNKVIRMPKEKDETDTEIGLRVLYEKGATKKILIGGGGGRLDHLIGIIILFHRDIRPDEWYTDKEVIISIDKKTILREMKGETVSFFPVGEEECRMKSEGLKWPLDNLKWKRGDAGISNLITSERMIVEPVSGRLICIFSNRQAGRKKYE